MNQETISKKPPFRGSPLAQRIGSVVLAAFIAIYLAIITYTFSDQPHPTKAVARLVLLWLIGLAALAVLSRAWRKRSSRVPTDHQQ